MLGRVSRPARLAQISIQVKGVCMMKTTTRSFTTIVTVITVLMVGEAVTFLLAALMHLGIPLGFSEPRIIPAAIVEGLCGLLLAVSTYAVVARTTWAWRAALAAHFFAVAGVLLGIIALALGAGPSTVANTIYHRVILGVLVVVLLLLATPAARAALGRRP
jgi:fluoride ion exporter CrcB/FEX